MKQFLQAIEEVEKWLIWISEKQFVGDSISEVMICEKAKMLHADLKDTPGTCAESDSVKASRGWLHKFKKYLFID